MAIRLGVDVGGTFTDLLMHDSDGGRVWLAKTPSTPDDQSRGVLTGIDLITAQAGIEPSQIDQILHGTTVATNAVLERRGARVGLIATDGFRYMLHLAEAWTPGPLFGFMVYDKPEPLVALEDVREAQERVNGKGQVTRELDEDAVRAAIVELRDDGVEALTVSLMNSFANPDHEQRIAKIATEVAPDLPLSISSEVLPEFREYERATTTIVNAYVAPALKKYLFSLRDGLAANGTTAGLQVVRSDGGLMSLQAATEMPVHTVLSGPAGGVGGATFVGGRAGFDRLLTFDMGGTSTDVAACIDGLPTITRETRVGDFPVRAPAVEVESIGAGGGSIAFIQEATGALRVGPQSAGAMPGPACYGRGGVQPTVTDANVVLGHLPPRLLGGEMELDVQAAHAAVKRVADPLGIDVHEAARGIIDLVNETMLGALRVVTVQRGHEPSSFALASFGGAGGLHANALAELLGSYPLIVPSQSGVLSALGFVASDVRNEVSRTLIGSVAVLDAAHVARELGDLETQAVGWLDGEGIAKHDQRVEFVVDMRYERQGFEIPVGIEPGEVATLDLERLSVRFADVHRQLYGFDLDDGAEIVCLRAVAWGGVAAPELTPDDHGPADPSAAQRGTHPVWTPAGTLDVPTYDRAQLRTGMVLDGYAIVEQYDATTVVLPGHTALVDAWQNLIIRPTEARS
jgi:N-methylhydantoinase A